MFDHYPIHELIENQQKRLGLRRNELARRCGFKNLDKGLRRIDGVCHGDLDLPGAKMVLDNVEPPRHPVRPCYVASGLPITPSRRRLGLQETAIRRMPV